MRLRTGAALGLVLLAAACGAEVAVEATGTSFEEESAPATTAAVPDTEAPRRDGDLIERAITLRELAGDDAPIGDHFSRRCRQVYGLVGESDPIEMILRNELAEPSGAGPLAGRVTVAELTGDVGIIRIGSADGGSSSAEAWVLEEDRWYLDTCPDLPEGLPLVPGAADRSGFERRLEEIRNAVLADRVGIYPWLSRRCRVAAHDEYEDWLVVLLYPQSQFDGVDRFHLFDQEAVRIHSIEAETAHAERIIDFPPLATGDPVDRWVFEHRNWYYDGCPSVDENAARMESQLEALRDTHAGLVDLEIEGLSIDGVSASDVNGPWELRVFYISASGNEDVWSAQVTYVQTRFADALRSAGYELTVLSGQRIEGYKIGDSDSGVSVHMDGSSEFGPHRFTLTLRHRP
jgi:hypothetical protein